MPAMINRGGKLLGRPHFLAQSIRSGIRGLHEGFQQIRKLVDRPDAQIEWCFVEGPYFLKGIFGIYPVAMNLANGQAPFTGDDTVADVLAPAIVTIVVTCNSGPPRAEVAREFTRQVVERGLPRWPTPAGHAVRL